MSSDEQILHSGPGMISNQPHAPANPLQIVHRLLRGRYLWAIAAAITLAATFGAIGYFSQTVLYQSTGLIRVSPSVPRILYQNEQNAIMPRFDSFVDSQVALIKSQRLIEYAYQNEKWQALKRQMTADEKLAFNNNLVVTRPKNSELIYVSMTDEDPKAAQIGVNVIVEAYDQLYGENDADSVSARMRVLEDRRSKLDQDYKRWQERIREIATKIGSGANSDTLDQMHRAKISQLASLESQLRASELNVALASGIAQPTTGPADIVMADLPIDELAMRSDELRQLLAQRYALQMTIDTDTARLGERHRDVVATNRLLQKTNDRIDLLVKDLRSLPLNDARFTPTSVGKSLAQLKAEQENIRTLYERMKSEVMELGRSSVEVASLQAEADSAKAKLTETLQRIEQLEVESAVGGRIVIESKGDQPLGPSKDKRNQLGIVGGLAGAGVGLGSILLIGLFDRRVMTVSDVRGGANTPDIQLLGVLPHLPEDLGDPEQALIAAHAVHQIRATLQHRHQDMATPVLAITSSSPGAGKTSLTLALALSYAASGSRVLMIDCDMVGGGLTSTIKKVTRRRIGHILKRQRVLNVEQINQILRAQVETTPRKKFGKLAVELGLASQEQVDTALDVQKISTVGLREAMAGDPAIECITGTGTPGLYVMPLGSAKRHHAGQFSYGTLRKIISQIKERFEVILIDTGPVLGSIEAMVVAAVATESILTVAKGEHRPVLNDAIERLLDGGHRIAGIVLNRAESPDIRMSGMSLSVNRRSGEDAAGLPPINVIEHEQLTLGPVASAVASLTGVDNALPPPPEKP